MSNSNKTRLSFPLHKLTFKSSHILLCHNYHLKSIQQDWHTPQGASEQHRSAASATYFTLQENCRAMPCNVIQQTGMGSCATTTAWGGLNSTQSASTHHQVTNCSPGPSLCWTAEEFTAYRINTASTTSNTVTRGERGLEWWCGGTNKAESKQLHSSNSAASAPVLHGWN